MSLLKEAREGASLDFFGSFTYRYSPTYLMECFPNLTVLNLDNSKSEFLKTLSLLRKAVFIAKLNILNYM